MTVVIPIRDRYGSRVKNCMKSLSLQTVKPSEIIISDYGSTEENHDKLLGTLEPFDYTIYYCETGETWSRPVADNIGIRRGKGKYIIRLDVDCILQPSALESILTLHKRYTDSAVVSRVHRLPKDLDIDRILLPDDYRILEELGKVETEGIGALFSAPRVWWHAVRGFDERMMGWGASDDDIVKRLRKDNMKLVLLDEQNILDTKVFHQFHQAQQITKVIGLQRFHELYKMNMEIWKESESVIRNDNGWGRIRTSMITHKIKKVPKVGVSIICWNEVKTIDLALKSIVGFASEVIVLDTGSTDGTQKLAQECIDEFDLSGYVRQIRVKQLGQARLKAYELCDGDWVLMQDANLVLSNSLKAEMVNHTENYSHGKANVGRIVSLNLMGDYEHHFDNQPFNAPHRVFVKTDEAKYHIATDRPKFKGRRLTFKNWAVNLSRVRPAWRCWYRGEPFCREHHKKGRGDDFINPANLQRKWQNSNKYYSIEEYAEEEEGMTFDEVREVAPKWFLKYLRQEARPLTMEYITKLPEVILEECKRPRYRLIYMNEEIIGRYPEL